MANREEILNDFQSTTGLNIEHSINFLNHYGWNLNDIVHDFYDHADLQSPTTIIEKQLRDDRAYAECLQEYERNWPATTSSKTTTKSDKKNIYHERQHLQLCALHSLNSLFQTKLFTKSNLDKIVNEYDKSLFNNDYKTFFFGNYDLRILMTAIQRQGYKIRLIDINHGEIIDKSNFSNYFGLLLNRNGDHWFTIKRLINRGNGQEYWNLDSLLAKPKLIGDANDLAHYLYTFIHRTDNPFIFVVYK